MQTLFATVFTATIFISGFAIGTHTISPSTTTPTCHEDQVLAPQIDPNPKHALTWACENIDSFVDRIERN